MLPATTSSFPRQQPALRGLLLSTLLGLLLAMGLATPPAAASPAGSSSQASRVFYVSPHGNDGNPGTQNAPWRTFAKAARTLVAGDVAVFEDGVYVETRSSFLHNDGTAAKPIVFKARNKHKAKLLFKLADRNQTKIRIYGEHVTIQGFEITQDRMGTNSSDIFITCTPGANYCTIRDNKIHRAWEECAKAYGYKTGIRGVLVEGNVCEDTKDGFDFVNVDQGIVRGNTITNGSVARASTALMLKGGIRNVQVYDNYIYVDAPGSTMWAAIQLGGYSGKDFVYDPNGYECYNSVAWNNVVHSRVAGAVENALGLYGASDCAYVNNVVIGADYGLVVQGGGAADWDTKTRNAYFKNNILVDLVRGATRFKTSEMEGRLVHDHNLYYNTPGAPKESGGVYADPRFVDKHGDWRLRPGSPALGRGQALKPFPAFRGAKTAGAPAIDTAKDRAGNERTRSWDLGIYTHSTDAQQSNPRAGGVGEAGRTKTSQQHRGAWQKVSLARRYTRPVVFMQPLSFSGAQPAHVRLKSISASDFKFQIEEWSYLDGGHVQETAPYLVLEAGPLRLADGTTAEAGTVKTSDRWRRVRFQQAFPATPVVLAQAQTYNDGTPIVVRLRNVTRSGFEVRLQEEEANDGSHAEETIGFVALAPGTGTAGLSFRAATTAKRHTHAWQKIDFGGSYGDPVFLAAMQTFAGRDPAGLRYRKLGKTSVEVRVEEEQSRDKEQGHVKEALGYVVFGKPGLIEGRRGTQHLAKAEPVAAQQTSLGAAPEQLELRTNYPNPFQHQTKIQYALPEAAKVRLEVFEMTGRRVAVLVDAYQAAGVQEVAFQMRGLPSGTYFYRLRAGGRTLTKKMTLIR